MVVKHIFRLMTPFSMHNSLMFVYGKQVKMDKKVIQRIQVVIN